MKLLLIFFFAIVSQVNNEWLTDFEKAKKIAGEKNEYILLNFSGSDWCGPCIRMKKEIFESPQFRDFSTDHLVLMNADFPRNKKNQLNKTIEKQNDGLADQYNSNGKFPYTVLMTANGKVIKEWDGLPDVKPEEFVKQLRSITENGK